MRFRTLEPIPFMPRSSIWIVLIMVLIIGLAILLRLSLDSDPQTPPPLSASETELRAYWSERVASQDGDIVYSEFKDSYATEDPNQWHLGMHMLSSLLYERYGVDAVRFCDSSFQQACFHELMSSYAYEGRVKTMDEIDDLCAGEWNCLHGVGHGLVMYNGYDKAQLPAVLAICPNEERAVPVEPCQSGIFMEYITRTMGTPRLDADDLPYAIDEHLCNSFPTAYRGSCHFVMVEWVVAQNRSAEERIADEIGTYCRSVAPYEQKCFTGAGFNAKFLTDSYTEGIELCGRITQKEEPHATTCTTALAMQYMFFEQYDVADTVCRTMDEQSEASCFAMLDRVLGEPFHKEE